MCAARDHKRNEGCSASQKDRFYGAGDYLIDCMHLDDQFQILSSKALKLISLSALRIASSFTDSIIIFSDVTKMNMNP